MKLFVFLFIGITTKITGGKPLDDSEATTAKIEIALTGNKSCSNAKETAEEKPSKNAQLPTDFLIQDILLDPSVILARVTRNADLSGLIGADEPLDFNFDKDGIPTFHFARFVRTPRSSADRKKQPFLERIEEDDPDRLGVSDRFTRSVSDEGLREDDLDAADDGFIIRPLFKYRHEQRKRSNARRYRNRDSYSYYYPRYPVFPGK